MTYWLWLDDTRPPSTLEPYYNEHWSVARNYDEFKHLLAELGFPSMVSFDYDLGGEKTGLDCAKYLFEKALAERNNPGFDFGFDFDVHSMNPAGKKALTAFLLEACVLWRTERFGDLRLLINP